MFERIGILATHPVQYHAPWFRYLADRASLTVYYAHEQSPKDQAEAGFGVEFEWDNDLLEGYEYRWLRNIAPRWSGSRFFRYNTPDIYDIIRNGEFSGFLVLGWDYLSAWQACRACLKNAVPAFMRGDSHLRNHRSVLTLFLKRLLYPYGLGLFSGHLYVGARNREYLVKYGVPAKRLYFAPQFVDCDYFRASADAAESSGRCSDLRRRHGIPENAFVYAFVGKLIREKRPGDFVEGVRRCLQRDEGRDVHALVVGDGPLGDSLKKAAATLGDRVHFTGFINQSEIPVYYRAADVVVLPSERESWGLVVNEAAACGRPAIVSEEVGCGPDLIDNQYTGFSYDLGDCAQLTDRMIDTRRVCMENPVEVREALGSKSSQYSIARASEGLLSAVRDSNGSR
jgi:glycosyltransferase involved in cell wall biosynthesis